MRIAVGADHAGFESPEPFYKPAVIAHLESRGHTVVDCGANGPAAVDYPDVAREVCRAILDGRAERGVLICGTGIGMSIAANRHAGIRAAVCASADIARLARLHNDANILCLGRRVLDLNSCFALIDVWMETEFSGEARHIGRLRKMD